MTKLLTYFARGLIFLVPIALSVYIVVALFRTIDGWLRLPVPGVGLVIIVVLVTTLGFLLSHYLTSQLLSLVERVLGRLPFVKLLHTSVKDMMDAFVGEKKRFDKPVLVEVAPAAGIRVVGFVTRETLDDLGLPGSAAVYLPQSYNFAGQLLLVPRERLTPLQGETAGVMTFIVSAGVSGGAGGPADAAPAG
jgi:uncharacterized membrane protein